MSMKKRIFVILSMVISLFLTSCTLYQAQGIENFHLGHSQCGLTQSLIPQDFLTMFPYERGDYDYIDQHKKMTYSYNRYETALIYMVYDEETYVQAKEYFFEHMPEDEIHSETYKTFVFKKNISPDQHHNDMRIYFAYSDEHRVLLAVGTRVGEPYTYITLGEYMATYFPFFNFEEVKIERGEDTTTTNSTTVTTTPISSNITEPVSTHVTEP
ncbi:MAG: hypothetical protein E7620_00350 [Ruminococcaceae bacterium]|nr:hypothetical protein [Oscillospiraceae bacterium]